MNNHRLLAGLLCAALLSGGVCADGQNRRVVSLEEIFATAEAQSARLRPWKTAEEEKEALDAGMNVHLSKPIDVGLLKKAVKQYIAGKE